MKRLTAKPSNKGVAYCEPKKKRKRRRSKAVRKVRGKGKRSRRADDEQAFEEALRKLVNGNAAFVTLLCHKPPKRDSSDENLQTAGSNEHGDSNVDVPCLGAPDPSIRERGVRWRHSRVLSGGPEPKARIGVFEAEQGTALTRMQEAYPAVTKAKEKIKIGSARE